MSVSLGQPVPDFSVAATNGKQIRLSELRGKHVVLYFYPKADTPGCTLEGQDFTRLHQEFESTGALILGASRDPVKAQERFCAKYDFAFDLLADTDETVCRLFGVIKEKNMYGRKVLGIERSTFLIDSQGVLRREWRGVKVDGHAAEVLAAVRAL